MEIPSEDNLMKNYRIRGVSQVLLWTCIVKKEDISSTTLFQLELLHFWHRWVRNSIILLKFSKYFLPLKNSYIIPSDVIPGRLALLITLMLCLTNMLTGVNFHGPKSSSDVPTILSIWMVTCYIFVVTAIQEYSCILLLKHVYGSQKISEDIIRKIDMAAFILSYTSFSVFNLVYWWYF